ncbi:uncharacterized protein METZ01_LOCUS471136, partial [marine metagenome]
MTDNKESETATNSDFIQKATEYIEPILEHLDTEDVVIEKE